MNSDGDYSNAGTVTFTLPDGTPAVGDAVDFQVTKITTDTEGHQAFQDVAATEPVAASQDTGSGATEPPRSQSTPTSSMPLTVNCDGTTDSEGKMHITLRWNGPPPHDQNLYLWMQSADRSRPNLETGGTGVTFQEIPMTAYPDDFTGSVAMGFGPTSRPDRVIQLQRTNIIVSPNSGAGIRWGHSTQYKLRIVDKNGYGYGGYISETFSNIVFAKTTCPSDVIAQGAPGFPSKLAFVGLTGMFYDTNAGLTFIKDTGNATLWYSFDQKWSVATPNAFSPTIQLNTHHITHYQGQATRNY